MIAVEKRGSDDFKDGTSKAIDKIFFAKQGLDLILRSEAKPRTLDDFLGGRA